jgi:hypothetical protein
MAKQAVDLGGGLTAHVEMRDGATWVTLSGNVTEAADFLPLTKMRGPLRFDLGAVERINSLGVRSWVTFVKKCETSGIELIFERCSPVIVTQISMISNFMGRSRVKSLYAPYVCGACNTEHLQLVEVTPGAPLAVQPTLPCPKCQSVMQLDELDAMYRSLFAGK